MSRTKVPRTKDKVQSTKNKARRFRQQRNLPAVVDRSAGQRARPEGNHACEEPVVRRAAAMSDSPRRRSCNCKTTSRCHHHRRSFRARWLPPNVRLAVTAGDEQLQDLLVYDGSEPGRT